jgi:hypothetical protein
MDSRLMKATSVKAAQDTADGVRQLHERMATLEGKLDGLRGEQPEPTSVKAAQDTADGVRQLHERMATLEGQLHELLAALRPPAAAPEGRRR